MTYRAHLLSAPYEQRRGAWRAGALIAGAPVSIVVRPEHAPLRKGDVVSVEFVANEWRVS